MDFSAPNSQYRSVATQTNDQQHSPTAPLTIKDLKPLKNEEDADILAWLKLARSLPPIPEYSSDLPRLRPAQVHAIERLKISDADHVCSLMRLVRTSSANQTSAASASPHIHDQATDQELEGPSILSGASFPSLSVTSPHGGSHQQNLTQGPAAPIPVVVQAHKYYCTYCDRPNIFKSQYHWRRHERDHLSNYVCMLNGATEDTPEGMKCAFCGELDPSEGHLSTHKAQICRSGSSGPFSCKERAGMLHHLYLEHDVEVWETRDSSVSKWRDTMKKQAWSCGFCVITFNDFKDRLHHIASHFEQGQEIREWDTTKLIQGLLQQPGVIKAWEEKLASLPTGEIDRRCWEKRTTKALRRDLEIGPNLKKTALDLAEAAFAASKVSF